MNEIANYPSLREKVVLITGGASGIGETIVENFLQQGSKVVFIDKDKENGLQLVSRLQKYDFNAIFKECDLVDIDDLKTTINQIHSEIGPISILVNNAANDDRHDIDSVTPDYWDSRMNVNLRHYFFASQFVLSHPLFFKK